MSTVADRLALAELRARVAPTPTNTVADIPDADLVQRAVTLAISSKPRRMLAWAAVKDAFGLGSTYSSQLCERFGFDPDTGETKP